MNFVRAGRDIGPGVKLRMLDEVFAKLTDETCDSAAEAAEELLLQCFRQVAEELRHVLKDLDDPLESAADAILTAHRGRLERSDARNRECVLAAAGQVITSCPASGPAAATV